MTSLTWISFLLLESTIRATWLLLCILYVCRQEIFFFYGSKFLCLTISYTVTLYPIGWAVTAIRGDKTAARRQLWKLMNNGLRILWRVRSNKLYCVYFFPSQLFTFVKVLHETYFSSACLSIHLLRQWEADITWYVMYIVSDTWRWI